MRSWKSWCDITSKAERVLAVDVGTARWGLAVSDALGLLAHPAGTIPAAPDAVDRLVAKAVELSVGLVLLGWPRRTDGGEGTMAEEVRRLAAVVHERSGLPVAIWDERLTTREAEKILIARGRRRRDRRQVIDELSAVLILQSYLDRNQEARPGMQGKDGGHMTQEHDHSLEDEIITLTDEDGEEHQSGRHRGGQQGVRHPHPDGRGRGERRG
jgi:putative Holliday junction resolvase